MLRISLVLTATFIAAFAAVAEPRGMPFRDLPLALQRVHAGCAGEGDTVYFSSKTFSGAVVFLISCPRERASSWPAALAPRYDRDVPASFPVGVYVAHDDSGSGVVRIAFPLLEDSGAGAKVTTLPVSAEALREAGAATDAAPPWIEALWKPDTRPDVCKIMASWRVVDGVAELRRWRVAPFCNKNGPQYETRFETAMPRLVVD